MKKQITAVDWLINELDYETISKFDKKLLQAKQMEIKQITDAWEDGKDSFSIRNAEIYYKETFKK
jgi:hypothetical protein